MDFVQTSSLEQIDLINCLRFLTKVLVFYSHFERIHEKFYFSFQNIRISWEESL